MLCFQQILFNVIVIEAKFVLAQRAILLYLSFLLTILIRYKNSTILL